MTNNRLCVRFSKGNESTIEKLSIAAAAQGVTLNKLVETILTDYSPPDKGMTKKYDKPHPTIEKGMTNPEKGMTNEPIMLQSWKDRVNADVQRIAEAKKAKKALQPNSDF